jgi:hypothetical protein
MSKAKFAAAKELIDEKKYDEARSILNTIDHPTAREWEAKLDKLDPPQVKSFIAASPPQTPVIRNTVEPYEPNVRMQRFWRTIWGVLTLLSMGWLCYGVYASTMAYNEVASKTTSEAGKGGAAIGASIGLTGFLCIGVPLFILFAVLYWRNGVAIRRAYDHAEMMNVLQR